MTDSTDVLEELDGKSSMLFLVAGGLLLVFAADTGARVFADMGYPPVHNIFGPAGFFVGLVGLFRLSPGLAGQSSVLARVTAIATAIPLVGWFLITTFGIGNTFGVLPDVSVVFPGGLVVVVFLTTMLTYLLFGVSNLRIGTYSRTVGIVLLAPAVPFLTLIVALQALPPVVWAEFVIDSGHALAHLTVGIVLWTGSVSTDRTRPAPDPTR